MKDETVMEKEKVMEEKVMEAPKAPQPVSKFEGVDLHPARRENELYCDYRCRQWWAHRLINFYLLGRPIWKGNQGQRIGSFSGSL